MFTPSTHRLCKGSLPRCRSTKRCGACARVHGATWGGTPSGRGGGGLRRPNGLPVPSPPKVLALLLARRLVDMASDVAAEGGPVPVSLNLGPGMERPSRIDGLVVDTRVMFLLVKLRPVSSEGI